MFSKNNKQNKTFVINTNPVTVLQGKGSQATPDDEATDGQAPPGRAGGSPNRRGGHQTGKAKVGQRFF